MVGSFKTLPNPPTVVTGVATAVTPPSATLNATVNPNGGEVSECKFEYGTTTAYGSFAPCARAPGSGESAVAVSALATGLAADTTYHFRVVATNAGGTSYGSDQGFGPPTVVTGTASAVMKTSATMNATVNPNNGEVSAGGCNFEYGTTTAYGSRAPCAPAPGSGGEPVAVSASVIGLVANTTYHFRVVATNAGGTSYGSDQTFTTLLHNPPTFAANIPPPPERGFSEPTAVAVDPSGNIWVADSGNDRVVEFNSKREFQQQIPFETSASGQTKGIGGIAANSAGDVYVTDSKNDRVQELSPTGKLLRQWGSPGSGNEQFLDPVGIAVDFSGNVWVQDTYNYRVQEFSATGEPLIQYGEKGTGNGQFGWASGLAFSGGNLYVADSAGVEEFSILGTGKMTTLKYEAQWGSSGTGNGQFLGFLGIASNPTTGDLYVADEYNNRIQEFSSAGAFLVAFGSGGSGTEQFSHPRGWPSTLRAPSRSPTPATTGCRNGCRAHRADQRLRLVALRNGSSRIQAAENL